MLTTNETRRLKAFSRKVWNGLTASEQCEFYNDTGTIGFVELIAELLHIRLTDDDYETFDAIQKYATEVKKPL